MVKKDVQLNFGCQETDSEVIMQMETVCSEGEMYSRQVENQGREGKTLKLRCGVPGPVMPPLESCWAPSCCGTLRNGLATPLRVASQC